MARDRTLVGSLPKDPAASTNSERAVAKGCTDPGRSTWSRWPRRRRHIAASPGGHEHPWPWSFQNEVGMTRLLLRSTARCLFRYGIILGPTMDKRPRSDHQARGIFGSWRHCCSVGSCSSCPHEVKGHTALWAGRLAAAGGARRCKAAAGRTGSCVNTPREEADAGRFATYSLQAPRWQTMATYHRGLPARERVIRKTGAESSQVPRRQRGRTSK